MEQLKKDITDLLNKLKETAYHKGSCGELGDSFQAIDADCFADIVNDIAKIVKNNYEPKKCMPEGINSKKEHEEYLKAIGYEKYVKDLEYHKEATCGLWAFNCDPNDLLNKFNASQSDAHSIECADFEQLILDWRKFCNNENHFKSPFSQISFLKTPQ